MHPNAKPSEIAEVVGVSVRTVQRFFKGNDVALLQDSVDLVPNGKDYES